MADYVAIPKAELEQFRKDMMRPMGTVQKNTSVSPDPNTSAALRRIADTIGKVSGKAFSVDELGKMLDERIKDVRREFSTGIKEINNVASRASGTDKKGSANQGISMKVRRAFENDLRDMSSVFAGFLTSSRTILNKARDLIGAFDSARMSPRIVYAAQGGGIFTPRGTDTVPAMLTPNEFVVNAQQAKRHQDLLHAINDGKMNYMSSGGSVGGVQYMAAGGGTSFPGQQMIMNSNLDQLRDVIADAIVDLIPTLASLGGGGGGNANNTGGGGRDFFYDPRQENAKQDLIRSLTSFESMSNNVIGRTVGRIIDKFRELQGIISLMGSNMLWNMTSDILDADRAMNNLTGATMSTAEASTQLQKSNIYASGSLRRSYGFTLDQVREAQSTIVELGVTNAEVLSELSAQTLLGSRAIGASVGETAGHYGKIRRDLRLSVRSISSLVQGSIRVARQTGMTAKGIVEIQRGLSDQIESYRKLGVRDVRSVESVTRQQAVGQQFGTGDLLSSMSNAFMGIGEFDQGVEKLGVSVAMVRSSLLAMTDSFGRSVYDWDDFTSGKILKTEKGRRDLMAETSRFYSGLLQQLEGLPEGQANLFISEFSKQSIKSREGMMDVIASSRIAGMSPQEQLNALRGIEARVAELNLAGFAPDEIADRLKGMTAGFGDINNLADLTERIAAIQTVADSEPLRNLAEAGDRMNSLIDRYGMQGMSVVDAQQKAFEDVRDLFGNINGTMGYTAEELRRSVLDRNEMDRKALEQNADQATQNAKDRFAIAKAQAEGVGASVLEFGVAGIHDQVLIISKTLGWISGGMTTLIATIGALKALSTVGGGLIGNLMGRGGNAMDYLLGRAKGTGAAPMGGGAGGGGTRGSGGMPSFDGPGNNASVGARGFLGELAKTAALIAVVGVTMAGMSYIMPAPKDILDTTQSLLISLGAFGSFYLAIYGFEKLQNSFGSIDVKRLFLNGIVPTLVAMTVIGPLLAGVMWVNAKAWNLLSIGDIEDTSAKVMAATPALAVMFGAVMGMAAAGRYMAKLNRRDLIVMGASIPLILGAMTAVGTGLVLPLKATSIAWSGVSVEEVVALNTKVSASATALTGLFVSTASLGVAGMVLAKSKAALNPKALLFAGGAMAAVLGGMVLMGYGLSTVMQQTIGAWSGFTPQEAIQLSEKFEASMPVIKRLFGGVLMAFAGGAGLAMIASTGIGAAALVGAIAGAAVGIPIVMAAMGYLGSELAVVIKSTSQAWSLISVQDAKELGQKFTDTAPVLQTLFGAVWKYSATGPLAVLGSALDLIGMGPSATMSKMGQIGRELSFVLDQVAQDWQAISVAQIEELNNKIDKSAIALEFLFGSMAKFSGDGILSKIGQFVGGRIPGKALDDMELMGKDIAAMLRVLGPIYSNRLPDIEGLLKNMRGANQILSEVARGTVQLGSYADTMDVSAAKLTLAKMGEVNTAVLKTINTTMSAPGVGNTTTPINLEADPGTVIAAATRENRTAMSNAADSPGIQKLVALTEKTLLELTKIRTALSFTPRTTLTKGQNAKGTFNDTYIERSGEMNVPAASSWGHGMTSDQPLSGNN